MSRKEIRQKIKDFAIGAGLYWDEEYEYWEDLDLKKIADLSRAIRYAFNLPYDCYLFSVHLVGKYEHLDILTDEVMEAIKGTEEIYDCEK